MIICGVAMTRKILITKQHHTLLATCTLLPFLLLNNHANIGCDALISSKKFDVFCRYSPYNQRDLNERDQHLNGLQATSIPELFSVAPMMGHTHRHYHYYFRHFSKYATLYTEMIPAGQVVSAYEQVLSKQKQSTSAMARLCYDEIQEVLQSRERSEPCLLDSILKLMTPSKGLNGPQNGPIVLQLGGRNPELLALATAIGTLYGYDGINLNCGCPSNAVSSGSRSGGAALMREPELVAQCVEEMSKAAERMTRAVQSSSLAEPSLSIPELSVKHRLGVHEAATYNAGADHLQGDTESHQQCREFVRLVTLGSHVSKVQVHARLGLLGDFDANSDNNDSEEERATLWVPGQDSTSSASTSKKVDHKRLQYRAKQRARQATIKNRSVPPLRPGVVDRIAEDFPHLRVVTNGGIQSIEDIEQRLRLDESLGRDKGVVLGAMVGRAAINHPCSFAGVDSLWVGDESRDNVPTREDVLLDYIQYCQREEDASGINYPDLSMAAVRRKLVAVPFHLFVGEAGNEGYQRRIRKLLSRADRYTSAGILTAALAEVPAESLIKPLNQFSTTLEDIPVYTSSFKRSGPLQRMIA